MSSNHDNGGRDWEDSPPDATRIDLGDDLLEKTAAMPAPGARTSAPSKPGRADSAGRKPSESQATGSIAHIGPLMVDHGSGGASSGHAADPSASEVIEDVRIMVREGLLEEAKKRLHHVMLDDPRNLAARAELSVIHELELRQMFNDTSPVRSSLKKRGYVEPDTGKILAALDRDLGLGLSTHPFGLVRDEAAVRHLADCIDSEMENASVQDNLDMGIGFLEMGLHDLAVERFARARSVAERTGDDLRLASLALLAYAQIARGKSFEARLLIEPVIADTEIDAGRKIEFFYLMGRACEGSEDPAQAVGWYRQVTRQEPHYRDAAYRLARCASATRS